MFNFFYKNFRLLFIGFLTAFGSGFGQTYFISLFGGYFRELLNLTNGEFGSYYSIATILSAISLIWIGKLIDNVELRKYVVTIVIGLSLTCLLVSSIINVYMLFISLYFLRLFGQGLMGHISRTTMARYFDKDRGKALAISSYGMAFGEILYPTIAVLLIGLIGWRFTWLVASIFIFIFFGMGLWHVLKKHSQIHQNFLNTQKIQKGISWKRREVLKDIKFYCYLPSTLLMSFAVTGFFFHQVHIAPLKGWDLNLIAIGLIFYAVFSIIGSTVAGLLVDKYNGRRLMPYLFFPFLIVLIFLMYLKGPIILFIYMSVVGLTQAVSVNLSGSLWAEMYGIKNLGSIKALMSFFGILASAASPFIFGIVLDQGDTLNLLILGTIILIIIFSFLSYLGKFIK